LKKKNHGHFSEDQSKSTEQRIFQMERVKQTKSFVFKSAPTISKEFFSISHFSLGTPFPKEVQRSQAKVQGGYSICTK